MVTGLQKCENGVKPRVFRQYCRTFGTRGYDVGRRWRPRADIPFYRLLHTDKYGLKAREIIKKYSQHREARQVLLEICYRLNLRKMSTREMGSELGGISGEQVSQVHKMMRERIKKERSLVKRVEKIISRLHT